MKILKINKKELRKAIEEQIKIAADFEWQSGWRLPIFFDEENGITKGGWCSQGTWQPGTTEIVSITPWSINEFRDMSPYLTDDEIVEEYLFNTIDDYIISVNRFIEDYNQIVEKYGESKNDVIFELV